MYVCIYICMCVYIYVCVYMYMCVYVYVCHNSPTVAETKGININSLYSYKSRKEIKNTRAHTRTQARTQARTHARTRKSTLQLFDLGAVISSLLKTLPLPSIQPTWPALSLSGRAREGVFRSDDITAPRSKCCKVLFRHTL